MKTRIILSISIFFSFPTLSIAAPHGVYLTQQQRLLYQYISPETHRSSSQKLEYYGGPVLSNVKVYAVFWGNKVNETTRNKIGDFLSASVNSTYFDWLKEYNTGINAIDGRNGTGQSIGRGTFAGAITI